VAGIFLTLCRQHPNLRSYPEWGIGLEPAGQGYGGQNGAAEKGEDVPAIATPSQLIELAYEGAMSAERFNEFVAETARAVEAPSGNVLAFEPGTSNCMFASLWGPHYTERVLKLYRDEFMVLEPHRKFVNREHLGEDTTTLLCHRFLSDNDVAHDPYFQDYLIPETGTRWLAGNLSFDDPDYAIQFGFARLADQAPFSDAAGQLLERLTPHLRRAVKFSIALTHSKNVTAALGETFGRHWAAIYLVDEAGRVVWMNDVADGASPSFTALSVKHGLLKARSPLANAMLEKAIRDALGFVERDDGGDFDVPDREGRRIPISVRPAGPLGVAIGGTGRARVAVLAGGSTPGRTTAQRLSRIYGLTAAEARLCLDLAEGLDIEDCATRRKTSPHTARTQLKNIFSKTGVRRQAELVALVWRWAQV
jgi:DNA-binding CsgD family transcriptional regulator